MNNKKWFKIGQLVNFLVIGFFSFLFFEVLEHLLFEKFYVDFSTIKIGWLAIMLIYGFKYHIICCLIPLIWAAYKCRHDKCDHKHCDNQNQKHENT